MAKLSPDDIKKMISHHFERQRVMLGLWQTLADHFYPERADFTVTRNAGQELASGLVDSYPVLVRRDLGNSFSAMLRDGDWFKLTTNAANQGYRAKLWLQWATERLRKLMYERQANIVRATKQGDHDYATFGQLVLSVERNRKLDGLLFRSWHLRDCTWWDDENGQVSGVIRKWEPPYHEVLRYFKEDNLSPNLLEKARDNQKKWENSKLRHIEMPSYLYGDDEITNKFPYVSIWFDMENETVIEETGLRNRTYIVPRFQTVAGSPFAYSPATVAGLPNSRCLQAMTHTLLEAGERYTRPPLVGTQQAIRGDVDLSPDGITWVDVEYDQKTGAALEPLKFDRGGFPIGLELRQDVMSVLSSAFYTDKLSLPEASREMTAYEVQERMKQYRRENLPLFAPIEAEYNGQLCELAMTVAMDAGMLGSPQDIPEELQGQEVEFKFKSPLSDSEEEARANQFTQISRMLAEAAELDDSVKHNVNFDTAFREAVAGLGTPARWLNSMESVLQGRAAAQLRQAAMEQAEMQQQAVEMQAAASEEQG